MAKLGLYTVTLAFVVALAGCATTAPAPSTHAALGGESRSGDDQWAERFASKQAWPRPSSKLRKHGPPVEPALLPAPTSTPALWSPQHCWLLEIRPCLLCSPAQRLHRPC